MMKNNIKFWCIYYISDINHTMAKIEEFTAKFQQYSTPSHEIEKDKFIELCAAIDVATPYAGTVAKIFRLLNYLTPDKETITLHQAQQYLAVIDNHADYNVWKAKYELLEAAHKGSAHLYPELKQDAGGAAPPAPQLANQQTDLVPLQGKLKVLVGDPKQQYQSQLQAQVWKSGQGQKAKPFVKVVCNSTTHQRAKALQQIFKSNARKFLQLLASDQQQWAQYCQTIHINSMVNNLTTTLFVTSSSLLSEELVQVFVGMFELTFNYQLDLHAHLHVHSDYDFYHFIKFANSSFYDVFTQNCKLELNAHALNFLKGLRRYFRNCPDDLDMSEEEGVSFMTAVSHLDAFEGDLHFSNSEVNEYELETKQEINESLEELQSFFNEMEEQGMRIREQLQLMDQPFTVQAMAGEWKAKAFLRLKGVHQLFLNYPQKKEESLSQE